MSKKKKDTYNQITIDFADSFSSEQVTGSCICIKAGSHTIICDCGMAQSNSKKVDYMTNSTKFRGFKPKEVTEVFISHLHGDHFFRTPMLYTNGCKANVYMFNGSYGIAEKMLNDCAYINERDAELLSKQEEKFYKPLFIKDDVNNVLNHIVEYPMHEVIKIDDELSFEFISSGHLFGGVQIILYITLGNRTESICYSGDIGNPNVDNRFVGQLERIHKCSCFIGETTYGNRQDLKVTEKERKNDLDKLKTIIDTQIIQMKGKVIIPTFSQSRCQQLALMIYQLYKNDDKFNCKVYIDSPLSINIFKEYQKVLTGRDKEEFDELLKWDKLVFVKESEDSKALVSSKEQCCVLSSSGMCQSGRIRHHLKANVGNPNATILFCGYSTEGSLSSMLRDNKRKTIEIDGKEYVIRCSSYSLKSMSGHAMFNTLIDYYSSIVTPRIILHHGDTESKMSVQKTLQKTFENKCVTTKVSVSNSSMKVTL